MYCHTQYTPKNKIMSEQPSELEHVEKTITLIETGMENESKTGAAPNITGWIKILKDRRGFAPILHDLEKLKEAMSAKDSKKICSLLEKLGNATVEAAEKAENTKDSASIKKLGKGLLKISKLAGKLTAEKSAT
jgi:hypothetical protein